MSRKSVFLLTMLVQQFPFWGPSPPYPTHGPKIGYSMKVNGQRVQRMSSQIGIPTSQTPPMKSQDALEIGSGNSIA